MSQLEIHTTQLAPLFSELEKLFQLSEKDFDWYVGSLTREPNLFHFFLYHGGGPGDYDIGGTGLVYDERGFPSDGVIHSITVNSATEAYPDWPAYTFTGLNVPVSTFVTLLATGQRSAFFGAIFAGDDLLIGADEEFGDDTLDGGAGADRMIGGQGNDIYYVDNAGDRVIELVGEGIDRVNTTVSFDARGQDIENIAVIGNGRANVVGNALDNVIAGNAQANAINGGLGADRMAGGGGNDVYYVDNVGDRVIEASGGGLDTVRAVITYTLGADVENLTLIGTRQINAIGNALNNTIIGNDRPNVLLGHGGRDLMTGGGGADRFDFRAVSDSPWAAFDRITDLEAHDVISLNMIDADTTQAGDQAFVLVEAFTRQAGQLTLTYSASGNHTTLAADVNGDGVADFRVILNGDHSDFTNFRL